MNRCGWAKGELYIKYHDEEWGVPVFDDQTLFEFLILEGAQAGLSWSTILNKRENYRKAFDHFNARKMARYQPKDVARLLANEGIVRNRLKIAAAILNAKLYLEVQNEFAKQGGFSGYIWQFVKGRPITHHYRTLREVPATTPESDAMSKDLRQRGFKFVGSTICYAYMQAVGMVNDHLIDCFRHEEVQRLGPRVVES